MTDQHPFKWRHFQADIILLCVRWYLRYALSYRDLEEMMLEREQHVESHHARSTAGSNSTLQNSTGSPVAISVLL